MRYDAPMGRARQLFDFVMIKPSHYDDDGYPIVWWKAMIPSNSLAALHGIARDCAERGIFGPDVSLNLFPIDETNSWVDPAAIVRRIRRRGSKALIGLVGVQSNQYDRALDLARQFRAAGLPVVIGGFHVSGCLSMLKEMPAELQEAIDLGCTLFAGECEERRLDQLLLDAFNGELKPVYNYLADLPGLADAPVPMLPAKALKGYIQGWTSMDLGRGCPFQCSFCTIINVQGRKSRFRTADDLEAIVRENVAQGVKAIFITDDNLARNRHWEEFFDRLIHLRESEGLKLNLTIQVDTLCHRIPNFIEKAKRAGAMRVFIGLENINPDNLLAANKRQNKITEYRHMIQQWHERGVFVFAGYILGFPGDTKASILRDIEIIKRELPIDVLEFFVLTPLPGSQDHSGAARGGRVDGSRSQQVQSPPPGHPSSADERRGMGRGLSRGLEGLFHLGPYGDGRPAARPAARQPAEEGASISQRIQDDLRDRGASRARGRSAPPEAPPLAPAVLPPRAGADLLSALRRRDGREVVPLRSRISQGNGADQTHPRRSGALGLRGRGRSSGRSGRARHPGAVPRRRPEARRRSRRS